jgi:putative membrane protein (TIGR04086 family)
MDGKNALIKVGNGVLRATIITLLLLVLLAAIMNFNEIGSQVLSVYYLVVTCVSILYGSIYAARKNKRRGWIVGILVALLYMIILYLISAIFFQDLAFTGKDFLRLAIALLVGALSGMLGINL